MYSLVHLTSGSSFIWLRRNRKPPICRIVRVRKYLIVHFHPILVRATIQQQHFNHFRRCSTRISSPKDATRNCTNVQPERIERSSHSKRSCCRKYINESRRNRGIAMFLKNYWNHGKPFVEQRRLSTSPQTKTLTNANFENPGSLERAWKLLSVNLDN